MNEKTIDFLITEGEKALNSPRIKKPLTITEIPEAEDILNNLDEYPYMFVFGCVMDRQIKAERAWVIPYLVGKEIGGFDFDDFLKLDLNNTKKIFNNKKLHRFNNDMAECFYSAIQNIHFRYNNHAENIWSDKPKSALIIRRFLEFKGVGVKIANMAAIILARDFKIPMQDYSSIDIAPDVQVKKYFISNGLLREDASNEELIYLAREIYPKFPGLLDFAAWRGGREIKRGNKS